MENVRIQKLLAEYGVASRRAIEEMVIEGRITVNGQLVNELPFFVDPEIDEIRVDGQLVRRQQQSSVYFLLNKPQGVVCTQSDPKGRPLAHQLVPSIAGRVYSVGGLDDEATGVVLLTNDGELTRRLTSPRLGLEMTYVLEIDGRPSETTVNELKRGSYVEGRRRSGMRLKILEGSAQRTTLEITTSESRNSILRMTFKRLGHRIRRMKRTGMGPITDWGLKIGRFRPLTPRELRELYELKAPPARRGGFRGRRPPGAPRPD